MPGFGFEGLVCPQTRLALEFATLEAAEARMGRLRGRGDTAPGPGVAGVLVREDGRRAYPVVDGIPHLLAPEALGPPGAPVVVDLADARYAEAYEERGFYDRTAEGEAAAIAGSQAARAVQAVLDAPMPLRRTFPRPAGVWADAIYDGAAQLDAYAHLAGVLPGTVVQLGGKGIHAVKLLLAGAARAWVVSPMPGELTCAVALARYAGVADRLRGVAAIAEELPFPDGSCDGVFSGGSIHHTVTELALPEIARVLRPGGRFAAFDPWKAPLYDLGTRILGKRETSVHCRPLTDERLAPLARSFPTSSVIHHGTLTRYPLIALSKLGLGASLRRALALNALDDGVATRLGLRRYGSSVAVLATR